MPYQPPLCVDGEATSGVSQDGKYFVGTLCLSRSTELELSYFVPVFLTALGDAGVSLCPAEPTIGPVPLPTALALTLQRDAKSGEEGKHCFFLED